MSQCNGFMSANSSYQSADIVISGYPYDGTSSYRPGSRFAPAAIREASYGLETYSPYYDVDLTEKHIFDEGDLVLPFGNKKAVLKAIQNNTRKLLESNKKVLSLGGEHLITYPIIQEYIKMYPDLIIIHFDAHADLRDEYLEEIESHATVMKLIYNIIGEKRIYQFGIRSGTKEEFIFSKDKCHFFPFTLNNVKEITNCIPNTTPVYITIDLDVLDPSIIPGTGTPEPGGVSYNDLMYNIQFLKGKNIVGADVVELSPDYDDSKVSNIVAAKVVRELLLVF
ncbi:MAG: agmatinase [Spirochaetota bacterium]|nr:agmatinase [Spirochaetota bacterium]